jgi:hypothetical protein
LEYFHGRLDGGQAPPEEPPTLERRNAMSRIRWRALILIALCLNMMAGCFFWRHERREDRREDRQEDRREDRR